MEKAGHEIVAVLTAIIGLATLAIIISKKSNTADVITNFANGFSSIIKAAVSPVTG